MSNAKGATAIAEPSAEAAPSSEPAAKLVFSTTVDESAAVADLAEFTTAFQAMSAAFYAVMFARSVQNTMTDAKTALVTLAGHLGQAVPDTISAGVKDALDWASGLITDIDSPGDLAKAVRESLGYYERKRAITSQTAATYRQLLSDIDKAVKVLGAHPLPKLASAKAVFMLEYRSNAGKQEPVSRSMSGDLSAVLNSERAERFGLSDEERRRLTSQVESILASANGKGDAVSGRFTLKVTSFS